jgi:thioredoxin reductase
MTCLQTSGSRVLKYCWPASKRHQKMPVENLYNVGDAVNMPGWIVGSGVAEGARVVAEATKTRTRSENIEN